ncbi:unnamed protein product [Diamesa serratosioi]
MYKMNFKQVFLQFNRYFASNFKRPSGFRINSNIIDSVLSKNKTKIEWETLRKDIIANERHISEVNLDSNIIGMCFKDIRLDVAESYIDFLQSKSIDINNATVGKLLRLYHVYSVKNGTVPKNEKAILELYSSLTKKHSLLDATTAENAIHGLCVTKEWMKSFELLDMIKITSSPNSTTYSVIITKAFSSGCEDVGWKLMNEMMKNLKEPRSDVYLAWFKNYTKVDELEKMLMFISDNGFLISDEVIEELSKIFRSLKYNCKITKVKKSGYCISCSQHLSRIELNEAEFKKLSKTFLDNVLIKNDVYLRSNPEEVQRFQSFVDRTLPYDCVIDGLNVAFSHGVKNSAAVYAKTLCSVVKHFADQGQKCLVLGRKHMTYWPKEQMNYIRKNSALFLTENISSDDLFILYAALKSGPQTNIFSRDLMRGHSYLLENNEKRLFRRWQQQHQFSLITTTTNGKVIIKAPIEFELRAHKVNDTWHIPFTVETQQQQQQSFEMPSSWLCLKI